MQNWNDLKFFLAVARAGSISGAASNLHVNQSTVSRRINHYEDALKVRLFERLSTGYRLTREGEELLQYAQRMEEESIAIERHIMGKNVALSGPIRVTVSLLMVSYMLVPLLEKFSRNHPEIELQLDISNSLYNISQREADVAIRVTLDPPPENLIGRDLGMMELGVYGSKAYLQNYTNSNGQAKLHWIGEDNTDKRPKWLTDNIGPLQLALRTNDAMVTVDAIKANMGIGRLPVFVGEKEPTFARWQDTPTLPRAPVWILTHRDIRQVSRITAFVSFMADGIREHLANYG